MEFTVEFYVSRNGQIPVWVFLEELKQSDPDDHAAVVRWSGEVAGPPLPPRATLEVHRQWFIRVASRRQTEYLAAEHQPIGITFLRGPFAQHAAACCRCAWRECAGNHRVSNCACGQSRRR